MAILHERVQKLLIISNLLTCFVLLYLYFLLYQTGLELFVIYAYFSVLALFIAQLFLTKVVPKKILIIFVVIAVLLVRLPIVGLNVSHNVVVTQGDQAYDTSAFRWIVNTGHIQPSDLTINFRNVPYSYYPAIHLLSSFFSLTSGLPETVVIALPPMLELLFFLVLAYILTERNFLLGGLFVFVTISFGYGFFHAQFIRETYASILQAFLIFFILLSFMKNEAVSSRKAMVVGAVVLLSLSFSHFYLQFTLLTLFLSVLIFASPFLRKDFGTGASLVSEKVLSLRNRKMILYLLVAGLLIFLAYDTLAALDFIRLQEFPTLLTNISQFFSTILQSETATQLSSVGAQQLAFERYLIYLQQGALILFLLFVSLIFIVDKKVSRKALLPMFVGAFLYFAALTLRLAQSGVINNLGLRASGLTLFFLSLYIIFLSRYVKKTTLTKLYYGVLILALVSVSTFPALLTQAYKDHTVDYEIPSEVSRTIQPHYPLRAQSYVYVGHSYLMPDWFYAFDSYNDIPRETNGLENLTYAYANSLVYVDKQFYSEVPASGATVNFQNFPLVSDTVVSAPGVQIIYVAGSTEGYIR